MSRLTRLGLSIPHPPALTSDLCTGHAPSGQLLAIQWGVLSLPQMLPVCLDSMQLGL